MAKYQLVFQFQQPATMNAFDDFIALEDAIMDCLAAEANTFVDGHDCGLGTFNIFIHTDQPQSTFKDVAVFLGANHPALAFSAGYRAFEEDYYTVLWPASLASFSLW